MSDRPPSTGLGFVDVLVGAMSAVLLVFIAQVSQPQAKTEYGGDQAGLEIMLDESTPLPHPNLAVRFRLKGNKILDLAEVRKHESRIKLLSGEDGFSRISISFKGGSEFEEEEELLIYVHDLNGRPRVLPDGSLNPIRLKAQLITKTQPFTFQTYGADAPIPVLDAYRPAVAVKLADVCGQGKVTNVVWRKL